MKLTWEYIAGFFDGEGCICFYDFKKKKTYKDKKGNEKIYIINEHRVRTYLVQNTRIFVQMVQKENKVLKIIGDFLVENGIKSYTYRVNKKGGCDSLQLSHHKMVQMFLENIYPYLIVKKDKAELALEYIKSRKWQND